MHVKTDDLVDIAEGTRPEASAPHLAGCEPCRAQLQELRAMMSAARAAGVPEPSPLFWDHLSSRVREAVAAEAVPRRSWLDAAAWRRVLTPAWIVAVASLIVVVALSSRVMAPQPLVDEGNAPPPPPVLIVDTNAGTDVLGETASDDASLMLVASLASAMDLDAATAAGLAPSGSAEHAVTHMSENELRELGRLLQEALAHSGA